jgi:hypothetical protein
MSRRKKDRSALENRQPPDRYPPPEPHPPRPNKPFLVVAFLLLTGWWLFLLALALGGR